MNAETTKGASERAFEVQSRKGKEPFQDEMVVVSFWGEC